MTKKAEKLEIQLLFEAMYRLYGYDFRQYSYDSARRRVLTQLKQHQLKNVSALQHLVIYDETAANDLLLALSINVTEMFRDPEFFKELRQSVLPKWSKEEHLKVWHAGCSSGEEVYSMAILMDELALLSRTQFYATDFNAEILNSAKQGVFKLDKMREHIGNYHKSGGVQEFSDYYHVNDQHATIDERFKKYIMFSHHNLTEDGSFGEMNIIICRNVLIYFDKKLQNRVLQLFSDSLAKGGYLCLGSHESIRFCDVVDKFEVISESQKIYRKCSDD